MRARRLEELGVGDEFEGRVLGVGHNGVWLDIGAEKAAWWPKKQLLPHHQWGLPQLPEDLGFEPGDRVSGLKILDVTTGDTPEDRMILVTTRVAVSELSIGSTVEGTVATRESFGVFFDIGASKDGLALNKFLGKAGSKYKPGDRATLNIEEVRGNRVTVRPKLGGGKLRVGDKVSGTVVNATGEYGLFLDIGEPREALLRAVHLERPIGEYSRGDRVAGLRVSSVDTLRNLVEVSRCRSPSEVEEGEHLEGRVASAVDGGVFFDAGLATHAFARRGALRKPASAYAEGEVVLLKVLTVTDKRVIVTTKGAKSSKIARATTPLSKLLCGVMVSGCVRRAVKQVGLFVDIGSTQPALLRKLPKPVSEYRHGEQLEAAIIKVDPEEGLLEVALPEMEVEAVPLEDLPIGTEVTGIVTRVRPKGARAGVLLDVGASADALWQRGQLSKPLDDFEVGERVEGLEILEVDLAKLQPYVTRRLVPAGVGG